MGVAQWVNTRAIQACWPGPRLGPMETSQVVSDGQCWRLSSDLHMPFLTHEYKHIHRNKWTFTNLSKCITSRYCFHRKLWPAHLSYLKGNLHRWMAAFSSLHFCLLQTPSTQRRIGIVYLLRDVAVKTWLRKIFVYHWRPECWFPSDCKALWSSFFLLLLLYIHLFCLKNLVRLLVISTLKMWHFQFACNFWRLFTGQFT